MILAHRLTVRPAQTLPANFITHFHKPQFFLDASIFKSKRCFPHSPLGYCCLKFEKKDDPLQGFSVLASDNQWNGEDVWSTMAFYIFCLHIPLSFGGLSVIAYILHRPVLHPETEAVSLLFIQLLELVGTLLLLKFTAQPHYELTSIYRANELSKKRNWLLASILGFGFLVMLVFFTSVVADRIVGPKLVNNPIVKEILLSSQFSRAACMLVCCTVTPLLEETIYRGFLLTSLSSIMKWQNANIISSLIFSAAHLSGENFIQLFIIGWVLGCTYCWTGNLKSSILLHSLYNAMTIMITILS